MDRSMNNEIEEYRPSRRADQRQSKQPSPKTKARKKEVVPLRTFLFSGKETRKPSFFEARPQPPKSKNERRLEKRSFFSRKTKPNRAQKETQHKTQRYEPKFCCQQGRSGERCEAKIQQSTTCSFQYMSWARISAMLEGLVCCDSLRIASHQRPFFVNSNTG